MIYAPIIIPTLYRDKYFIQCIESLKKNKYSENTDVYIALDFPLFEKHKEGYSRIINYLEGDFSCFRKFVVIKREKNYGAVKNTNTLIDDILKKYDRFIFSEDDNEFSLNFLEYMNKCLEKFETNPKILAVCGYSYPIKWEVSEKTNIIKQNNIFNTWGTGYWRDKYLKVSKELVENYLINEFNSSVLDGRINKMSNARFHSYVSCFFSIQRSPLFIRTTDVSLSIYMQLKAMFVIMPTVSKVRNHGFDGSGLYCQNIKEINNSKSDSYDYRNQRIDTSLSFNPNLDTSASNERVNWERLNKFIFIDYTALAKSKLKVKLYKLFGRKNYLMVRKMKTKIVKFIRVMRKNK